MMLKIVL